MQKKQREYYLREQLKAIRAELGEGGDEEAEITTDPRTARGELQVPDCVMKAAEEQLERLSNIPSASPEYGVILSYLDWLCDSVVEVDGGSPASTGRGDPRRRPYDLAEVKDRILEYLAVRKLKADMKGPILCFVGPPGVGKTSLGRSIARAMGREFVRMSLGGMRDEAEIRGHRRTYIGAMPGRIVQSLKLAGTNNPVFMTRSTRSAPISEGIRRALSWRSWIPSRTIRSGITTWISQISPTCSSSPPRTSWIRSSPRFKDPWRSSPSGIHGSREAPHRASVPGAGSSSRKTA